MESIIFHPVFRHIKIVKGEMSISPFNWFEWFSAHPEEMWKAKTNTSDGIGSLFSQEQFFLGVPGGSWTHALIGEWGGGPCHELSPDCTYWKSLDNYDQYPGWPGEYELKPETMFWAQYTKFSGEGIAENLYPGDNSWRWGPRGWGTRTFFDKEQIEVEEQIDETAIRFKMALEWVEHFAFKRIIPGAATMLPQIVLGAFFGLMLMNGGRPHGL